MCCHVLACMLAYPASSSIFYSILFYRGARSLLPLKPKRHVSGMRRNCRMAIPTSLNIDAKFSLIIYYLCLLFSSLLSRRHVGYATSQSTTEAMEMPINHHVALAGRWSTAEWLPSPFAHVRLGFALSSRVPGRHLQFSLDRLPSKRVPSTAPREPTLPLSPASSC